MEMAHEVSSVLRRAHARVRARGARADDPVGLRRRRRRPRRRLGVGPRRTFGKGARVGAGRGDPRGCVGGGAAARRVVGHGLLQLLAADFKQNNLSNAELPLGAAPSPFDFALALGNFTARDEEVFTSLHAL